ncbi:transcription factor IIIB 90 kDa subunit-like [Mya arenaria]|uniref:transcription factor IIIB 90 kDa subunit-like n=1 Tax=Mya arenaria TaxID=6604 RepID=UPI0022E83A61|nr:transcription factor IIIB 90 kDa subunit-like [Mya arenaria]
MSSRMCNQCGCTDIDIDSARGDAVCTGCGSVLEDQIIVSEVQFQENSGGGSSLIGQFVSSEGGKSFSIGGTFTHGMQKESRTVTLQNGKKKIQHLASQLNLNNHCVDTAFNFYKMAVAKRMTMGRKSTHVIAACLYLVCRVEKTSHMLLDFSDALQVNVYSLGRTYLHLSRELCINLPDVDPCLYISRFAHALQFGDKTHEVSMTAMRLVSRMKRDWMSTGRRPSGLCGAALLVSARIHEFSRTVKEIIKVVKVCQTTLRKRLLEFEETPSSQLTIEEFQTIDLEEEQDPPCFTEGKKRAKKVALPDMTCEISKLQEEIEETLANQKPRGIWAAYAKMPDDSSSIASEMSSIGDLLDLDTSCDSGKHSSVDSSPSILKSTSDSDLESKLASQNHTDDSDKICEILKETDRVVSDTNIGSTFKDSELNSKLTDSDLNINDSVTGSKHLDKDTIASEIIMGEGVLNSEERSNVTCDTVGSLGFLDKVAPLDSGVSEIVSNCMVESNENSCDGMKEDEELDLTGIDDDEIDRLLLTEKEIQLKTKIWMTENADYLEEQKLKEEKRLKEAEEEAKKPPEKRRKKIQRKKKVPLPEATTPQEAIQRIIQEKRISCKINYDVLNDLNVRSASSVKSTVPTGGSILKETKGPVSRLHNTSVTFDLVTETPPAKKQRKEELPPILPQMDIKPTDKSTPDVVIESGPVQYEQKDDGYGEEEEDYFEEEDQHLSAAQMLGHTGGEEDYDYDD